MGSDSKFDKRYVILTYHVRPQTAERIAYISARVARPVSWVTTDLEDPPFDCDRILVRNPAAVALVGNFGDASWQTVEKAVLHASTVVNRILRDRPDLPIAWITDRDVAHGLIDFHHTVVFDDPVDGADACIKWLDSLTPTHS